MEVCQRIKKLPQTVCRRKKISRKHPLKNKTIPETVRRTINNFCKPSITSIKNMSECLKMFKFIIAQSSNIQQCEHSYHWKYGSNYLNYIIILFQKIAQTPKNTTHYCWISDDSLVSFSTP